ncbi:hypothetical protein FCV25MIE_05217 [Fagus crenata]
MTPSTHSRRSIAKERKSGRHLFLEGECPGSTSSSSLNFCITRSYFCKINEDCGCGPPSSLATKLNKGKEPMTVATIRHDPALAMQRAKAVMTKDDLEECLKDYLMKIKAQLTDFKESRKNHKRAVAELTREGKDALETLEKEKGAN